MLLTVAIPTYQCPSTFFDSFVSVYSQISKPMEEFVEILIIDNGSSGNPMEMLDQLDYKSGPSVRFFKNQTNLGYDANIVECLSHARGNFVKFIADDDILLRDSLRDLLWAIDLNPEIGVILQPFVDFNPDVPNIPQAREYSISNQFDESITAAKGVYGQISSVCFNRKASLLAFNPSMLGSNFVHVSIFFSVAQSFKVGVFGNRSIAIRRGSPNFSQSDYINLIVPVKGFATFGFIDSRNFKETKRRLVREYQLYVLGRLALIRTVSFSDRLKILVSYLSTCGNRAKFWYFGLPLIILPKPLRVMGSKLLFSIRIKPGASENNAK